MRSGLKRNFWRDRPVVYRIYDADDRLLYVGSTNDLGRRLAEHSGWWTEIAARIAIQLHPALEAARAAEAVAIQEEQPLMNIMGTGRAASDKSYPGWTRLDWARAEEYRTRRPSHSMRSDRVAAVAELEAALAVSA